MNSDSGEVVEVAQSLGEVRIVEVAIKAEMDDGGCEDSVIGAVSVINGSIRRGTKALRDTEEGSRTVSLTRSRRR